MKDAEEVRLAFIFSCFTGLRLSDVGQLRADMIHNGAVQVRQKKTGGVAYNPLHPEAWKIIEPRMNRTELLFDFPKSKASIWRWLKRWQRTTGIWKQISFHTSRHTFAMLALSSSKGLYAVNKLMGHTKLATTALYLKILDETKKTTIDLLPGL